MSSEEEEEDFLHTIVIDIDLDNTMSDSSDSDALPDLVDSTDEDSDSGPPELSNAECADIWLRRKDTFREKQEHSMRLFAQGPFLFALRDVVPTPWMGLLHTGGLLKNNEREKELTSLTWVEWGILDLLDDVIGVVFKKMLKRNYLVAVLTAIDNVDTLDTEELSFENSFPEAAKENLIIKLWMKALRLSSSKTLEKEAKCAVLYVCKIYHTVVVGLARHGRDVVDEMKKRFKTKDASIPMKFKDTGNEQYQYGHFEKAIDYYTKAAKEDPFNHIFFGNRAQSYNKLKKHREALADGRRAVALKPDWAKGYYRYAQALYELDKLTLAISVNRKGLEICRKSKTQSDSNMKDLEQQGMKFRQRRDELNTNKKICQMLKDTECGVVEVSPTICDTSGEKRVIDLTSAINATKVGDFEEDDVPPLSDSSSDDDVPELIDDRDDYNFPPPGKELLEKVKNTGQKKDENKPNKHNKSRQQSTTNQDDKPFSVNEPETLAKKSLQCGASDSVKTQVTEESNKAKVEKKEPEKPLPPPKDPEIIDFEKSLSQGYFASQNGNCTKALKNYERALELTAQYGQKHFSLDNRAMVSLKYVYGSMAVDTGIYKNILDGVEKFNDIIRCHDEKKFPLAFYGLAKASIALNRNKEAMDPLKTALKITNNHKLTALQWPGETAKIDESIHQPFVKLIKHLMLSSRYPPPPDAKCRYHSDDEDNRSWIYLSDPDFKGFTRILCNERCIIEFHNHCWKVYKCKFGDMDRLPDKEMLDTSCPTPECKAFIIKIVIIRQDKTIKEIVSDKKHPRVKKQSEKSRQKTPASSLYKIERKRERKEWRKKRRQELREERDDLMEELDEIITPVVDRQPSEEEKKTTVTMATAGGGNNEEEDEDGVDKVNVENSSVFKREEEDNLDKYKVVKKHKIKKKKEKEKVKQVIAVDFNFSDDKQLVNEHTQEVEEEEDRKRSQKSQYGHQPFSVPSGLESTVQAFERSYAKPPPKPDEISLNLFSFFEDLLAATGPLHTDDIKITSILEDFPQDAKDRINKAGGLCKFLQQSVQVKFAMIDDVVCLLRDAAKARDISQKQANPVLPETKRKNAWESTKTENTKVFTPAVIDKPSLPINGRRFNNIEDKKPNIVPVTSETVVSRSGGIDSLDDFSLSSPVKYPRTAVKFESTSMAGGMDTIDDISYPKTKRSSQNCDGLDSISDTESNKDGSVVSDWDSVSCRSEEIVKPIADDEKILKSLSSAKLSEVHENENLNASRSSSRSDVSSEKSDISSEHLSKLYNTNGVTKSCDTQSMESMMKGAYISQSSSENKEPASTAEFMSRAYKTQGAADPWSSSLQPSPRSVPPVPASWTTGRPFQGEIKPQNKSFGPIGSPVLSSDNDSNTVYKPKPQVTNKTSTLTEEAAVAAKLQEKKVDQQLVSELAEEVMKQMFESQPNVSENVKQETFQRVTRDIWDDFNKCAVNQSVNSSHPFSYSNSSGNIWTKSVSNWDTSASSKHSFAEQFMKSHYQTEKTIPDKPNINEKTKGIFQSRSTLLPAMTGAGFSTATSSTVGNNIWSSNHGDIKTSSFSYSSVPPPLAMPSHRKPVGGHSIWSSPTTNFSPTVSQLPVFNKTIAPPPINTLLQNGGPKNVMSTAVQVVTETRCVETNTDPFDDYKDRYLGVKEEKDNLESNFRTAAQQIQELNRMLQEREHMCKMFEAELGKKQQQLESLSVMWEEKEKSLTNEITRNQKELKQNQQLQTELLEQCNGTEKKLSEVQASVSRDREVMRQLLSEKELAVNNANEFCISMKAEVERAKSAEIEVLREQQKSAMAMLTRSQKEAQFHTHKLSVLMKKCQEEKQALPVHLQQTMDHYQTIKRKCEEVIKRLDHEFDEHIQQIRNGKKLSDLPQIHVPPPPPPPPLPQLAIQASMANNMAQRALPSSIGTNRGSEPTSPPTPLSMPSLYDRGVEDSDKTPMKMLEHSLPPKPLVPPGAQPKPLAPPLGVQPRPLAPPSGTVGHLPPRPLIGARPPLAGTAVRPSLRTNQPNHAPKNSFEKLIERLQIVFPKYNRAVFTRLIQQLRQDRGGSLSGMTLDQIVQNISELVISLEKSEKNTASSTQSAKLSADPPKPIAPPPGLGGSWGFAASTNEPSQGEVFEEVEDPCVICYEEMTPATTANLDCGHMFHDACIRKWFREQSTCPNCRKHALMPDEYPTLK